jgi:DNA-binding winged helix-turn-helix (wHTH) protein/tetratricopeptide (TPR) repeat protein
MVTSLSTQVYRFGPFRLDLRSGDLTRNGRRIQIQEKPRQILMALVQRPGDLITRAELRDRLWPADTFVDFEDSLNTAMRHLREVLGDNHQSPRYIETMRGRGYRFVAHVEPVAAQDGFHRLQESDSGEAAATEPSRVAPPAAEQVPSTAGGVSHHRLRIGWFLVACCVAVGVGGIWYWLGHGRSVLSSGRRDPVLIADFENQTGDARFDKALATAFTVGLEQSRSLNIYSRLQAQTALHLMQKKDDEPITATIGREICQRENLQGLVVPGITRAGHEYRLTAQLIDPSTGIAVASYSETAHDEDHILSALDSISTDIRRDLGESRYEIHRNGRPLPQVTTSSMQALEDYAEAADFFGKGRVNDANRLYNAAIAVDPGFAMAHAGLAYMDYSFYVNQPVLGDQEFQKALALAARTTERERAWIEMRYAESQGRIEDALDLYRIFLQRFPGDWVAQYSYARLLRMHGHAQESIPMYRRLIQQQPDNPGTWIELASAYSELDQWGPSIEAYEKAFALDPSRMLVPNINHEFGFALIRSGNQAQAGQVFSAMLGDSSTYPYGERSLALLDMYHGQYESARRRLMLALPESHDPFAAARIYYMLAAIANEEGNQHEEIAQLDNAMAKFDQLGPKVIYGAIIGQAYARAGETTKARQILDRIAPIANERIEDQVAYLALLKAEVAAAQGDLNAALQFLKPPEADDNNSSAAFTRESLAHIYEALGNRDAAIAWYAQFLKDGVPGREPQRYWSDAEYTLAADYRQKGDGANAIRWVSGLLDQWKDADSSLPLLKKARLLRDQMVAVH